MKLLITIILLSGALLSFGQSSFIHLESQNLPKKSTEYFGSLADKNANDKTTGTTFINYNPTIIFNGIDDYLKVNKEVPDLKQMTVFSVFMPAKDSDETFDIWGIQTENSIYAMTNTKADNTVNQFEYSGVQNGKVSIHCYAQYFSSGLDEYTDGSSFIVFGRNEHLKNNFFKGAIAEFEVFRKVLTTKEKSKIFSRLAIKYGVSLKEKLNYLSSDGEIIWDAINDEKYSNRITGIGRDDVNELYQKQSTSSDNPNFLVIGVDSIQQTNEDNLGFIPEKYFILWGDNGAATMQQDKTSSIEKVSVLDRKWLINVTGNSADEVNTQVKINASTMLNDSINSYIMVIDESGKGDFDVQYTRFIYPTAVSEDGIITYDRVEWDCDKSGNDIFSFKIDDRPKDFIDEATIDTDGNINLFTVYPNITNDGNYNIYVQLEEVDEIHIKVFDMAGKLISDTKLRDQNEYLLDGVPIKTAGIYNIALYTKFQKLSKKIIVEN